MKKMNRFCAGAALILMFGAAAFTGAKSLKSYLYTKKPLQLNFDHDYYWPDASYEDSTWIYERVFAGFEYYLYIPPQYREDRHNPDVKLPLFVIFHGSGKDSKYASLGRFGRIFVDRRVQDIRPCAVLVLLARNDYYENLQDTSLLIQNVLLKNECLDKDSLIAYGHSQGAYFAVKLACHQPELFKAVISGSGYYQVSKKELLKVLPVQFYFGLARNDKGIYEQGILTGPLLEKYCRNSIYAEYPMRGHFYVELKDAPPGKDTTFLQWLEKVLTD